MMRRTSFGRGLLCVLMLAGAGVAACNKAPSRTPEIRYGVELNPQRKEIGLPLVDPAWRTAALDGETLVWSSPLGAQRGQSSRYDKLVVYSRGKIVEEVDFYTNGAPYTLDVPGTGRVPRLESVVIHYNYERAARGTTPWSCALTRGSTDEEMSLTEAEGVLTSWGMRRVE